MPTTPLPKPKTEIKERFVSKVKTFKYDLDSELDQDQIVNEFVIEKFGKTGNAPCIMPGYGCVQVLYTEHASVKFVIKD
jgi:hypothetical protein